MKRRPDSPATSQRQGRPGAGKRSTRKATPSPGWKSRGIPRGGWRNPRLPSVPATLDLTLDEYFAAGALMGILASQAEEPSQKWCCDWSFKMGKTMAAEALRRRKRRA